ncbi:MAG: YggS family pyridoxal phosphate-dependent enzyme [Anaerolineales bacterium]|nr:YggS family pyridoxal phosphate-dependent enzyme [Anaerolineales bacterium]
MIIKRLTQVQERINRACERAGRDPADVTLVAVTKTWPVEVLLEAYAVGLRHFGENRTYEIEEKRPWLERELGADNGIVWHYIADLQSRQTQTVADLADYFHALDRLKIARRLSARLAENGRVSLPVLLQVNVSGEASKAGVNCHNWETAVSEQLQLHELATAVSTLPHLQLHGLMTMAPWHAPDDEIRTVFSRTRALRDWLADALGHELPTLSMGMTDDFELAILAGATHIRVGRALFGERS